MVSLLLFAILNCTAMCKVNLSLESNPFHKIVFKIFASFGVSVA